MSVLSPRRMALQGVGAPVRVFALQGLVGEERTTEQKFPLPPPRPRQRRRKPDDIVALWLMLR